MESLEFFPQALLTLLSPVLTTGVATGAGCSSYVCGLPLHKYMLAICSWDLFSFFSFSVVAVPHCIAHCHISHLCSYVEGICILHVLTLGTEFMVSLVPYVFLALSVCFSTAIKTHHFFGTVCLVQQCSFSTAVW